MWDLRTLKLNVLFVLLLRTMVATLQSAALLTPWSPKGQRSRQNQKDCGRRLLVHRYEKNFINQHYESQVKSDGSRDVISPILKSAINKTSFQVYCWKVLLNKNTFSRHLMCLENNGTRRRFLENLWGPSGRKWGLLFKKFGYIWKIRKSQNHLKHKGSLVKSVGICKWWHPAFPFLLFRLCPDPWHDSWPQGARASWKTHLG